MKRPSEITQEELCRMLTEMSELERKIDLIDHRLTSIYEDMQAETDRYLDEMDRLIDEKGLRGFLLPKTRTTRDSIAGDDFSADVLIEYARRRPISDEVRRMADDFEAERQRHPLTSRYAQAGSRFIILATQGRRQKEECVERLLRFTFFDDIYDPGQASAAIIYVHSHEGRMLERSDIDFVRASGERKPGGDRPRDSAFEEKVELMKAGIAERAAVYTVYNPSRKISAPRLAKHAKDILCTQYYDGIYGKHDGGDVTAKRRKGGAIMRIAELEGPGQEYAKQLAEIEAMHATGRWKKGDFKPN